MHRVVNCSTHINKTQNEIQKMHTSTVLMCLSKGSEEEVELTASSSFSFSLIHRDKAPDSLLRRSHCAHILSSCAALEDTNSARAQGHNVRMRTNTHWFLSANNRSKARQTPKTDKKMIYLL